MTAPMTHAKLIERLETALAWDTRDRRSPLEVFFVRLCDDDLTSAIAALRECDELRAANDKLSVANTKLRLKCEAFNNLAASWGAQGEDQMLRAEAAEAQLSALKAEAAKVIEPFGSYGNARARLIWRDENDGHRVFGDDHAPLTVGHFRAAHAFHARLQDKGGD